MCNLIPGHLVSNLAKKHGIVQGIAVLSDFIGLPAEGVDFIEKNRRNPGVVSASFPGFRLIAKPQYSRRNRVV